MHWGSYEVFSLLSGVVLVVAAAWPGMSPKDRLWGFLGGAFFVGYAIYVASQTSGVFYFPWIIFVIPFGAVGFVVYRLVERTKATAAAAGGEPHDAGMTARSAPAPSLESLSSFESSVACEAASGACCPSCHADLKSGAKFCSACGAPASALSPVCPNCGSELAVAGKFCERCGAPTGR